MFDILFAFLNFGILVGILYYGWNRFIAPILLAMMHKETAALRMLHEENGRLLKEKEIIDESLILQEALCDDLFTKVKRWKSSVEAKDIRRAEEERMIQKNYQRKVEEQSEKHRDALLVRKIKPLILAQVEEDLEMHFKNAHSMHLYMDRLFRELQQ